ncbi:MAG: M20 family metallopeptidase [Caldilineaceae bacterium]|nr:M20 family metallopeptidase [Caldilineaceae bacterium]
MARLAERFRSDEYFMDREFDPPTNGFNMVIDDGRCAMNVTAGKTICTLSLRSMPKAHSDEAADLIVQHAQQHGLEVVASSGFDPFYVSPDAEIVQAALQATGMTQAGTVSFGTEAILYQDYVQSVVLGPGNIAQAHTVGEWIDIDQLRASVQVYGRMIEALCM